MTQKAAPAADGLMATLEDISDAFFMLNREWRFTFVNKKAVELLQQSRDALVGAVIWERFRHSVGTNFDQECRRAMAQRCAVEFESYYAPWHQWFEIHAHPSGDGLVVYFKDVTARRRLEWFKTEQMAIMERIAAGAPLQEVLLAVIDLAELHDPRSRCSVLLLDESGQHLRHGAAPKIPQAFIDAIDGVGIGPSVGSCGTAAFEGRTVIVSDIATDPLWKDYRDLALGNQLRACWSMPITGSTSRPLGTFAVYYDEPRAPGKGELDLLTSCSHLVSVVIEREQATEALKENEKRFREQASLLDKAQDAIIVVGIDERIMFWNKGAERMYGWTREEAAGKRQKQLCFENAAIFHEVTVEVLDHGEWNGELTVQRKDGALLTIEGRWTLVREENGAPQSILSIHTDMTERKAAQQEIHKLAFYDSLTGLPNRQLLLDRLEHAQLESSRSRTWGALMLIDLDDFKSLNDTLGHDKGDLLLQQVALRLRRSVRESDTVARWGGDEFVVVMNELGTDNPAGAATHAGIVAEQILGAINLPYFLSGHEYHSTPSVGIALFQGHSESVDEVLKHADLAMYQAKGAGRNTVRFFDPEMQAVITARVALESDIRHGLHKHEFLLYYQPQIDRRRQIVGVEALIRWRHSQRGLVTPANFIPLAEETGLILPLGRWVLEAACRQLVAWAAQPETAHLTMAVNVSARQFRHADFVRQVLAAVEQTGADPHRLKLELTESLLLDDVTDTIEKMHLLKAHGIGFSLDDFGTGYSSLSYLKQLPLEQLKIDQSFVRDVLTDHDDATLVSTIITLGRSLGLKVVAEGVTSEQQLALLSSYDCDRYQGYLFSHPLPPEKFDKLAKHQHHAM